MPAMIEICQQQRYLAHHVDPAQLLAELDAVEDDDMAIGERHVAEMQITVALAHEAALLAARESLFTRSPGARTGLAQRRQPCAQAGVVDQGQELLEVAIHWIVHRARLAEPALGGRGIDAPMEVRHVPCKRVDIPRPERPASSQAIHQRRLGELSHPNCVLDGRSFTAHARVLVGTSDGDDGQIDVGSEAPIEA